jgi:hypothetical protein
MCGTGINLVKTTSQEFAEYYTKYIIIHISLWSSALNRALYFGNNDCVWEWIGSEEMNWYGSRFD